MNDFRTIFVFSVIGHFLIAGVMLAGSGRGRSAGRREVYYVQMVEPRRSAPPPPREEAPAAEAAEPEQEVRISSEERRRQEEERRKKDEERRRREEERRRLAEERARIRREIEEQRLRREAEERRRREEEEARLAEMERIMADIARAKSMEEFRVDAGAGVVPASYVDEIYNRLYEAWEPAGGGTGPAVVQFRIHRDGEVSAISIVGGSASGAFDESCRQAVLRAGRMPVLPQSIRGDTIDVRVRFQIGG